MRALCRSVTYGSTLPPCPAARRLVSACRKRFLPGWRGFCLSHLRGAMNPLVLNAFYCGVLHLLSLRALCRSVTYGSTLPPCPAARRLVSACRKRFLPGWRGFCLSHLRGAMNPLVLNAFYCGVLHLLSLRALCRSVTYGSTLPPLPGGSTPRIMEKPGRPGSS